MVIVTLGVDAGLLPVLVEIAPLPLCKQVIFIFRYQGKGRIAGLPGHFLEPLEQVNGLKLGAQFWIAADLRAVKCLSISPGDLLQFKGASLPDAAQVCV